MKLSRYLIIEKNTNDHYIIFSTITRAVVLLEAQEYFSLMRGNVLETNLTKEQISDLVEKHILIDDELVDDNYVEYHINYDRLTTKTYTTFIALSTLCNFSCVYCYEKGQIKGKNRMSQSEIDSLVEWYERKLISGEYDRCHIELYGGEPLLFYADLKYFLDNLKSRLDAHSIELELGMISNGYLLDSEKIDYLVSMGLKEVQITLDGTCDVHNSRRPLKDGGKTFDKIINNIKSNLNKDLTFVIRISFDTTNINNIEELIGYLDGEKLHNNILLYFAPIHQTTQQSGNMYSFCSKAVMTENKDIVDSLFKLYSIAKQFGYKIPYCYTDGPCMVVSKDSCLIAPDGGLYKCVEMIDCDDLCVGNVFKGGYNSKYYDFVTAPILKECINKHCIFVPMCGGGCMMQSYMIHNNCSTALCNRDFLEKINRNLLRLNFGDL